MTVGKDAAEPGGAAAGHRFAVVRELVVAEDAGAGRVCGGDFWLAMDPAAGLIEIHSLLDVGGDQRIVLANLGNAVDLHGEQNRNADVLKAAGEGDDGGRAPTVAKEHDAGGLLFEVGETTVVICVEALTDHFVSIAITAILKDLGFDLAGVLAAQMLDERDFGVTRLIVANKAADEAEHKDRRRS